MTTNELLNNIAILTGIVTAITTPVTIYVIGFVKAKKLKADRDYEIELVKAKENSFGTTKVKELQELVEKVMDDIEKLNQVSENDRKESSHVLKLYEDLKKDFWELMNLVRQILKGNK